MDQCSERSTSKAGVNGGSEILLGVLLVFLALSWQFLGIIGLGSSVKAGGFLFVQGQDAMRSASMETPPESESNLCKHVRGAGRCKRQT